MSLVELFCDVDDFCQLHEKAYEQHLLSSSVVKRIRRPQLSSSELMTIIIHFHQSYRTFKDYYTKHVMKHLIKEFPTLVSYNRFVALMPRVAKPVWAGSMVSNST